MHLDNWKGPEVSRALEEGKESRNPIRCNEVSDLPGSLCNSLEPDDITSEELDIAEDADLQRQALQEEHLVPLFCGRC